MLKADSTLPELTAADRSLHMEWLREITPLPTAAGREFRVVRWIEAWAKQRPDVALTHDPAGNMVLSLRDVVSSDAPVFFTAHLDHPAFVVERIVAPGVVELGFRGGVMDEYFEDAAVAVHTEGGQRLTARLTGRADAAGAFKHYQAELKEGSTDAIKVGDVATWDLPAPEVIDGIFHTPACDDLAALAAAISAFDVLRRSGTRNDVRVLLTRAEEIGFIGAIASVKHGTVPRGARVITLENSRSFDDSPIGGGPIVRVGDRMSIFSPSLTDAVAKRAEAIAGAPSTVTASQKQSELPRWKWQRKLMAGGACEATVFCSAGYEATCVCLPLGNYHNMADLAAVQAGTNTSKPTVGREYIAVSDYEGLVDLLVACGLELPRHGGMNDRLERLYSERKFVLD